jgi:hypothetical protein
MVRGPFDLRSREPGAVSEGPATLVIVDLGAKSRTGEKRAK